MLESHDVNIATTDNNLSVNNMFMQASVPSLAKQIFSVLPINGPIGGIFNIKRVGDKTVLLRKNVECYSSPLIKTGLTSEAIQDIKSQFSQSADQIIGTMLRSIANDDENEKTLEFLETHSLSTPSLDLTTSSSAEDVLFAVTRRCSELVLKMNNKTLRTYEARVVLPYKSAGSLIALSQYAGADEESELGLFMTKIGNISYFLNPDPLSQTAYIVLKDSSDPSKSSGIFSPYQSTIVEAQNPDTGNSEYFLTNRFALTESPLHELNNEMFYKFTCFGV